MATPGTARLLVISQIAGKSGLFCLVAAGWRQSRQIRCQPFRAAFPLPIGSVRNRTESLLSGRAMGVLQIA
jgi:hypothetical protein